MLKVKVGFKSSASGAILEQLLYEAGLVECGSAAAAFPASTQLQTLRSNFAF
jgi:hypothetical protein